ncbi:MAG: DUF4262 domain-containing protein [Acidimicrobiia bacterium]|nr:DUF4262 domain-containing protein [Acidimicrobiia bacterium]
MSLRDYQRHLKTIKQYGWACHSVSSSADEPGPNWVYTIGVEAFGQPELIIVGMPDTQAATMLNDVCRRPPNNKHISTPRESGNR